MRYLFGIPLTLALVTAIIHVGLAVFLTTTYHHLTQEPLVATITFDQAQTSEKQYTAHVRLPSGEKLGDYVIYGNQWRMDVAFIKMTYWANALGIPALYALNRIEGRYKNIHDENTQKHQSYALEYYPRMIFFRMLVDTRYGSSVYQDIHLGVVYQVRHSATGLLVREEAVHPQNHMWHQVKEALGF